MWEKTVLGLLLAVFASLLLTTPTTFEEKPKNIPVGLLEAYSSNTKSTGIATLISEKEGVTAAHILEDSLIARFRINGKTYSILQWERIRPQNSQPSRFAENDLARFVLQEAPPRHLPRIPLSTKPPHFNKPLYIAKIKEKNIYWMRKIPFRIEGASLTTNSPRKLYQTLLWLNHTPYGDQQKLEVGDSGGPWIQDGKIVAVSSTFQTLTRNPSLQLMEGSGTWKTKQPLQKQQNNHIAYRPLLLSLLLLILAYQYHKSKHQK